MQAQRLDHPTQLRNVTSSRGSKGGDLEIRGINLAGKHDFVIDLSLVHDFTGNSRRDDFRRNGQLRYDDPDLLLYKAASAKVQKYREDY